MKFTQVRIFNGALYGMTDRSDIFQIAIGASNLPEVTLVSASSTGVNIWPDWLMDASTATDKD